MNLCRWLGACLFLMAVVSLVASPRVLGPVSAQDKKEDKKEEKKAESKQEQKKAETKQEEKKTETKADTGGGTTLKLTAFDPGQKSFFQELKTSTTQTMKVMGQEIVQKQEQTFVIEWTPKAKDKDEFVVTQKIAGIKMNIDIGGNKIAYDSTNKSNAKNPMTDFFDQLLKQELTFHIGSDLKVKDIKGRDEFIKSLGETNPQMMSLLKQILSQDALTKMAEPTWWALPDKSVKKGDTWNKDSKLNLGPIGTYETTFNFTYDGKDKNLDKILIKADLTYKAPTEKEASGLPFTIKEAKLASKSASGEALFDQSKGRFDSSTMKMALAGKLTITVGNMNTEIDLDQQQDSVSKSYDTNPWPAETKAAEKTEKK